LQRLGEHLKELDRQVDELNEQIQLWHRENAASRKLADIPGIGPITASALVASIGDAKDFESGRQLAAWLGLVPRQHTTGGKHTLLGISKRGDCYLRTLLIHGAEAVIRVSERKVEQADSWLTRIVDKSRQNALICQVSALEIRMETYAVDLNYGYSWFLAFLVGNSHYTLPITQTTIETGDIRQKCFDAHSGK
jgi:transposase